MSLSPLIGKQIKQSQERLAKINSLSSLLLEDVLIRVDRHTLEPLRQFEYAQAYMIQSVKQVAVISTDKSNSFLDVSINRMKEKAYKIVGRSPGLIEDIAAAIAKPIKDIIDAALTPVKDTIKNIQTFIDGAIKAGVETIKGGVTFVVDGAKAVITKGQEIIGEGINLIKSTVNGLLESIANAFDTFTVFLQKSFDELLKGFEALLRITPEAMFDLQKSLTDLIQTEQAKFIKNAIKET